MSHSKAVRCARLSQEIYQNFSALQFQFSDFPGVTSDFIEKTETDTQCAVLSDTDAIYIVFRGSENRQDWKTNIKIYPYKGESSSGAKMHRGFASAYLSVRERIHKYLKSGSASNVTVTGHSLGGALATLCAVDVQYNFGEHFAIDLYTFGAPRVGNSGFRESFNRRVPNSYRYVNGMDIVPALPRPWLGYRHVDEEHRLGARISLNFFSRRVKDHKIANYIAALEVA